MQFLLCNHFIFLETYHYSLFVCIWRINYSRCHSFSGSYFIFLGSYRCCQPKFSHPNIIGSHWPCSRLFIFRKEKKNSWNLYMRYSVALCIYNSFGMNIGGLHFIKLILVATWRYFSLRWISVLLSNRKRCRPKSIIKILNKILIERSLKDVQQYMQITFLLALLCGFFLNHYRQSPID